MDNNGQIIHGEEVSCACLALSKALVGISELYLSERASKENKYGSFRIYKAIQTYYVVFNIFASYIVMYENIEKISKNYVRVDFDMLNSEDNSSQAWKKQKILEQDLITLIKHGMIMDFCKECRKNPDKLRNSIVLRVIYEAFIDEDSGNIYEKLCYIRDRAIYRPSHVMGLDGSYYQTSKYVRSEIDSLPDSDYLFQIFLKYVEALVTDKEDIRFYFGRPIGNDKEYLNNTLSISDDTIIALQNKQIMSEDYSVPDFLCHIMELENIDIAIELFEKFWVPTLKTIWKNK